MKVLLFIFTSVLFISCEDKCSKTQSEIQHLMKDLYKKKINFPPEMEFLNGSSIANNQNGGIRTNPRKFAIVHFFTADCDKCINELLKIQEFLSKLKKSSYIDFIFIASAPTKFYVLEAMKKINFKYPIYYEKHYYSFKTMNKLPIENDLYNTMLLNINNEAILFGAFYDNEKAGRLYLKAIECGL